MLESADHAEDRASLLLVLLVEDGGNTSPGGTIVLNGDHVIKDGRCRGDDPA